MRFFIFNKRSYKLMNNSFLRFKELLVFYIAGPSRNPSYYFWAFISLFGSLGFLSVADFSFRGKDFLGWSEKIHDFPFIPDFIYLPFFPQGATMGFYGIGSLFLSFYLWFIIFVDVGGGYDMFDKKEKKVAFVRWGFPNDITLEIPMEEILSLRIATHKKTNFFNRTLRYEILYLETENDRIIPLTRLEDDLLPIDIAYKAFEISRFLDVPVLPLDL
uniref:Photosystem I assembly protein Ycf4 n=1 Tax=Urariopsis brevissima TaxID=2783717 RepID=A0A7S7AC84_9FABA|nr:photosystem I assembly protein Ycf4 [Urariopsis brevissima]QOW40703.1 photosystem I assembly protein Ycf4 [Urariopsis brevissima]